MRILPSLLIVFTISIQGKALAQTNLFKTLFLEESTISISGTSNVNSFTCTYQKPLAVDTLVHEVTFSDSLYLNGDVMQLSSNDFDCGSRPINRDMRKTLKAGDFPFMELAIHSIEIADSVSFSTMLDVTIAGVTRREEVIIQSFDRTDGRVALTGMASVLLTNYSLKPPSAMFGLVKVDDEIQINLSITMEQKKG